MGRHQEKVSSSDEKYTAMVASINPHNATAIATIKHRERGRMRTRLNAAKFEAKRSGNGDLYIQAGVDEMMKILNKGN